MWSSIPNSRLTLIYSRVSLPTQNAMAMAIMQLSRDSSIQTQISRQTNSTPQLMEYVEKIALNAAKVRKK